MHTEKPLTAIKLIDLCVVALIVFATATVMRPVFLQSHDAASATCVDNMKQVGIGVLEYVQDYDGRWPAGSGARDHWAGDLIPYLKNTSLLHCPNDNVRYGKNVRVSYAMNSNLAAHLISKLTAPASTVVDIEYDGAPAIPEDQPWPEQHSLYTDGNSENTAWGSAILGRSEPVSRTRHDHLIVVGACDGHVKLLPPMAVSGGIDSLATRDRQSRVRAAGTGATNPTYALTFSER